MSSLSIFVFLCFHTVVVLSINVLEIKNIEEEQSYNVTIKPPIMLKSSMYSICCWIKLKQRRFYFDLLPLDDRVMKLKSYIYVYGNSLYIYIDSKDDHVILLKPDQRFLPHVWYLLCVSIDARKMKLEFFINDKEVYSGNMNSQVMSSTEIMEGVEEYITFAVYNWF